jgi:hypothetical protein
MAFGVVLEEIRDRHFGLNFRKAMSGSGKIWEPNVRGVWGN